MPSRPTSRRAEPRHDAAVVAVQRRIAKLEAAMWQDGFDAALLPSYQQAFRELEARLPRTGRHHIVIVIPVADSPEQLAACLDSLLELCRSYHYGGERDGRFERVSVLLADDSADPAAIAGHRHLAEATSAAGVATEYFGLEQQLALLRRVDREALAGIIGVHPRDDFAHKGQAMMRNIAYLRLAELAAARGDERFLFYTVDADQRFRVAVPGGDGPRECVAINYLYHLDRLFAAGEAQVLTGKVVGDPPVSPAVMAGNFLEDVLGFVAEMAAADPAAPYEQPAADGRGSGEAAYHDMAELFGFAGERPHYRFRCALPGPVDNARCFTDFADRLNRFFHGEHPTRVSWYHYQAVDESMQPARTVYTGNYVFSAAALDRFIPFAPLRLRMSGPTMGRLLKAELGRAFVSANLPMLHTRTVAGSGESEYRPGVVAEERVVDFSDEFERQFYGDVMLFSIEGLAASGSLWPDPDLQEVAAAFDAVRREMRERYGSKQALVMAQLERLRGLLDHGRRWWHSAQLAPALRGFQRFIDNLEHNFGDAAASYRRIDDPLSARRWRERQLAAVAGLQDDRTAWRQALERLRRAAR